METLDSEFGIQCAARRQELLYPVNYAIQSVQKTKSGPSRVKAGAKLGFLVSPE